MKYTILRTDLADEQLRDIIYYIAEDSGSVEIALRYLDKLESAINRLSDFPECGSYPKYSILKNQGYRVLIVEKHLVFYKLFKNNNAVTIYAIIDGRREYNKLL